MKENAVSNAYMFMPLSASGRMLLNKLRTLILHWEGSRLV
jgi:hypothetical protein